MANHFTQFCVMFPVGADHVGTALALYQRMREERDEAEEDLGFEAADDGDGTLRLHDGDGQGDVEAVIAFALRCAEECGLTGLWGFRWGLSCSRPRLDGFGGGAHVLDLGQRKSLRWLDCGHWLAERLAADASRAGSAEAILQPIAAAQGWTLATQAGVLLDFIDRLIAHDPGKAEWLRRHLVAASAEPEEMLCQECGEPMFVAAEGTSHHAGDTMDGIDHTRDRDHTAIADPA